MKKIIFVTLMIVSFSLNAITFGQNKIQRKKIEWKIMNTLHFKIYYPEDQLTFAKITTIMAEEAYYFLKKDFSKPIKGQIPLIVYTSHAGFSSTNIIYPLLSEGVGGFTESRRNRVVLPFQGDFKDFEETLIHELTHAYVNSITQNKTTETMINVKPRALPFWFSEGLPEFEAIQGTSIYNNMFVYDLILNEKIPNLNNIGGYFAYRLGESYLTFLADEFGRKSVIDYFYSIQFGRNDDRVTNKIFGKKSEDLQNRWKNYIRKKYFETYISYEVPYQWANTRTNHKKDEASMHYSPAISPDGKRFVYFSNKKLRTGIWSQKIDKLEENKDELIIQGEKDGRLEEFHFQKNNLAWFSDSKRVAFVAKNSFNDNIFILDVDSKNIVDKINLRGFEAIFELDISPDDSKIVFSGMKNTKTDIYEISLENDKIKQITNDYFWDGQPKYSPDGTKILFASDRKKSNNSEHISYFLGKNIFYYDFLYKDFYQVTFDNFDNYKPVWRNNKEIIFLTERREIINLDLINLETNKRASVSSVLNGTLDSDVRNNLLVFTSYFNLGWNIYSKENAFEDLDFFDYKDEKKVKFEDNFFQLANISNYKKFGFKERIFKKNIFRYNKAEMNDFNFKKEILTDKEKNNYNSNIDKKPISINPPNILNYSPNFRLDNLWGGMSYSQTYGTVGYLQLSMSDLMGNHGLGFETTFRGSFKDSDLIFNYMYLARKIDYGVGFFQISDDVIYRNTIIENNETIYEYYKNIETHSGFYWLVSYPFNKFWRFDFENSFYHVLNDWDKWNDEEEKWESFKEIHSNKINPKFKFVKDSSLNSSTGPISGQKLYFEISQGISTNDTYFTTFYADLRNYFYLGNSFSLVNRLHGGTSIGNEPQVFNLNDYYFGIRGYSENSDNTLRGNNKFVGTTELRFTFLEYLKMKFPLPINLYNIRGAVFADLGTVWDKDFHENYDSNHDLNNLYFGFGGGPRFNLGFFIVQLDVAWNSDLISTSKPTYFFRIAPEF